MVGTDLGARRRHPGTRRVTVDGATVAELSKGVRVSGAERAKLASSLRARYDRGDSIRALAASSGRSYGFVHRLLTEDGHALRRRGGATRGQAAKKS